MRNAKIQIKPGKKINWDMVGKFIVVDDIHIPIIKSGIGKSIEHYVLMHCSGNESNRNGIFR